MLVEEKKKSVNGISVMLAMLDRMIVQLARSKLCLTGARAR